MYRVASLLLAASLLVGCNISDDRRIDQGSNAGEAEQPVVEQQTVSIAGRVVKGVIEAATIELFLLRSAQLGDDVPIATAVSDQFGYFSLDVPAEYLGLPVYVELSVPGDGAQTPMMTCDIPLGCGGPGFGFPVALEPGFSLSAMIPALKRNSKLNISLVTHLAAERALNRLRARQPETEELNYLYTRVVVERANTMVANKLGVIGDITALPLVDITSIEEVQNASSREMWYSVVNAGVVQALQSEHPDDPLDQILAALIAEEYTLSQEKILTGSLAVAGHIQENFEYVELSELLAQLSNARGLAKGNGAEFYQGFGSARAGLTDVEKAKALIKDISQVTASVNVPQLVSLANVSSLVDPGASAALDQFGFELSAAQIFEGRRSDLLQESLLKVLYVILDSFSAYYSGESVPAELHGVPFTHFVEVVDFDQNVHVFRFEQSFDVCPEDSGGCWVQPSLVITVNAKNVAGNQQSNFIRADSLSFDLDGGLALEDLQVEFPDTSQRFNLIEPLFVARALNNQEDEAENIDVGFRADSIDIALPVHLNHSPSNGQGMTVDAEITLNAANTSVEFKKSKVEVLVDYGQVSIEDTMQLDINELRDFAADFNMDISNDSGDNLLASVALKQTKAHIGTTISYQDVLHAKCPYFNVEDPETECKVEKDVSGIEYETEDNFLSLIATVGFKANLRGIDAPVLVEVSGARVGPKNNQVDQLKLRYPGNAISMVGAFGSKNNTAYMTYIDAVNLDGIHLNLDQNQNGDRAGRIQNSLDEEIAQVTDMGQWIKVVFGDGSFKSLCGYC